MYALPLKVMELLIFVLCGIMWKPIKLVYRTSSLLLVAGITFKLVL